VKAARRARHNKVPLFIDGVFHNLSVKWKKIVSLDSLNKKLSSMDKIAPTAHIFNNLTAPVVFENKNSNRAKEYL